MDGAILTWLVILVSIWWPLKPERKKADGWALLVTVARMLNEELKRR